MTNKSTHILSTSSNLLGFTFLVLSSIKGLGLPQGGIIDEAIALCVAIFSLSSFLSFLSIRTKSEEKTERYELLAEYIFLVGMLIVTLISILLALDIIVFRN
jgi:hypothetical protein